MLVPGPDCSLNGPEANSRSNSISNAVYILSGLLACRIFHKNLVGGTEF